MVSDTSSACLSWWIYPGSGWFRCVAGMGDHGFWPVPVGKLVNNHQPTKRVLTLLTCFGPNDATKFPMENWLKASSLVSKSFRSFTFKSSQLSFQSTCTSWRHWAPGHGTPNTSKVRANWRNSATERKKTWTCMNPDPVWTWLNMFHLEP